MTDKEMQIDSLANALYSKQDEYDISNPFEVANCVINLGYRKIPEGSVVITGKETDECLEDLLIEFDEMSFYPSTTVPNPDEYSRDYKKRLIYAIGQRDKEQLKDCIESNKVVEERTRKETAREIFKAVFEACNTEINACKVDLADNGGKYWEGKLNGIRDTIADIMNVAKQYGVEVQEWK